MGDPVVPRVEVSIGDVQHSQLVVGDHNTIQTAVGTEVTVLQVGERPTPKLRAMPISRCPKAAEIVGREEELALISSCCAGKPVQLYAEDGAGKTCLLKFAARKTSAPAEGAVFEPARHRSLDEIQAGLYAAFWECDIPFVPAPAQFGEYLADREALLILDDCALDRSELGTLLDRFPRSTVVLASEARTLWSGGTARKLGGLDPNAAVRLLERELGNTLDADEQAAAETVAARLGGHPQSLVEVAALIEDGRSSLRELADDPAAFERRLDPSTLTDPQKRMLAILSALNGAPLGTEHVAALANLPDAEKPLRDLERRGWVKSASPCFRSVRRPHHEGAGSPTKEIAKPLLTRLTTWSEKAPPNAVADEAEAIERTLELGAAAGRWDETLGLSLNAQRGLTVAGAWSSCRRVLQIGLEAAGAVGNESARAFVLHQLGSQALCLGDSEEAAALLTEALHIREGLHEHEGAELTRHNLRQLEGGGDGGRGKDGDGGGSPRGPRIALALAGVAVVVAGLLIALALAGGDGKNTADTGPSSSSTKPTKSTTTTRPPAGARPVIAIESPADGDSFSVRERAVASFVCTPAKGAEIKSCQGVIDGEPVDNGAPLVMSPGDHALQVTAVDDAGRESESEVRYSVEARKPRQSEDEPPVVSIFSPTEGQYLQGEVVEAKYTCDDPDDPKVTCSSSVESGGQIDTETLGPREFTVTAIDPAGKEASETVTYEVVESESEGEVVEGEGGTEGEGKTETESEVE
ncbi:MAG: hypothetical protein ACTHN3_01020 [Solirubrobacterales bacterium]